MFEEGKLKFSRNRESGSGRTFLVLALLILVLGAVYFASTRNSSVQNAFSSIKESTQDAAKDVDKAGKEMSAPPERRKPS
jgi:hypothetical protein